MNPPALSRRGLLAGGLGLSAAATLAACSGKDAPSASTTPVNDAAFTYPAYVSRDDLVKPDLTSKDPRVSRGFLRYPDNPAVSVPTMPTLPKTVVGLAMVEGAMPPAMGSNSFWKELNKQLGTQLELRLPPLSDYGTAVTSAIASNQLPDIMQLDPGDSTLPALLKAKFAPLTKYLAGDAIKDYPNLAAIPTPTWRRTVFNGEIYGLPFPLGIVPNALFARTDLLKKRGIELTDLKDGESVLRVFKEVTDAKNNQFATCAPMNLMFSWWGAAFGVPNSYRVESNGDFTPQYATEEWATALAAMADAWKQGYLHPDSFGTTINPKDWFGGGRVVFNPDGLTAWAGYMTTYAAATPGFSLGIAAPPKWKEGGAAGVYQGSGSYTMVGISSKGDEERTKQLLGLINYFSAPFGSKEYLFLNFGVEGEHYTMKDGNPVPTAKANELLPLYYLGRCAPVFYNSGQPEATKAQFNYQDQATPDSVPDPTVGLSSPTSTAKSGTLWNKMEAGLTDIIVGRKSMTQWPDLLKQYLAGGGDQIAREYAQAHAAAK